MKKLIASLTILTLLTTCSPSYAFNPITKTGHYLKVGAKKTGKGVKKVGKAVEKGLELALEGFLWVAFCASSEQCD